MKYLGGLLVVVLALGCESSGGSGGSVVDSADGSGGEAEADSAGLADAGGLADAADLADPVIDDSGSVCDLVSAADAAELDGVQFVDTRSLSAFESGHLPGALHLHASTLRATVDGVSGQIVDLATAESLFAEAGIDASRPTVVYGAENDTGSARVLWTLLHYGGPTDLRLLDGGYDAWVASGGLEDVGPPAEGRREWAGDDIVQSVRVDLDWMLDHYDDPDVAVFDVRTVGEYEDGHIPGALQVEWTENLAGDGLFIGVGEIEALHGPPSASTVVVYCQSGSRAAVGWFALHLAALGDVRLYDGSWNEWGATSVTPKVLGPNPL